MWSSLQGRMTWWIDEIVTDFGRAKAHERAESATPSGSSESQIESIFVALREPWRLCFISLDKQPWSSMVTDDTQVVHPANDHKPRLLDETESWGDPHLSLLLRPSWLSFLPVDDEQTTASLDGPRSFEQLVEHAPSLVTLGADRYEVEIDPQLGVLTSWTAVIGERPAVRISLDRLHSTV